MQFFLAYSTRNGEVHVLPSFHFPTAQEARDKIAQLRRAIDLKWRIVRIASPTVPNRS
jgi:hypothetical protein